MAKAKLQRQPASLLDHPLGNVLALDWEKTAWIVLIVLAVVTRFYVLDTRVISHDESLHTYYSWQLYRGQGFQHTPLMHGPFQFHALALSYFLFGATDFTARIPVAVFGVAAVALLWYFRRWLGRTGALLAGLFMLISPFMLYYARYVRNESYVVVWALLMAIATFRYFETRNAKWLYVMVGVTALMYATKEVAFIYVAIWMLFLGFIFIRDMLRVEWRRPEYKTGFRFLLYLVLVAVAAALLFGAFGERMLPGLTAEETVTPVDPNQPVEGGEEGALDADPAVVIGVGVAGAALVGAAILALLSFREGLRRFASVDLLVILGTFVIPQLTAFPVKFILRSDALDYSQQGLLRTVPTFIVLLLISAGIGMLWDWKKWLIAAGVFFGIFIPLFTTMFTNGNGFATGVVGSLGYWLDQQGVKRGNQPWYYYIVVQTPVYEFLPAIGSLIAVGLGIPRLKRTIERWLRPEGEGTGEPDAKPGGSEPGLPTTEHFPVVLFLGFWIIMSYAAYSLAGEKMPWLTVHMTLPMILMAGWSIGQLVDKADWQAFREGNGWVAAILIPLTIFSFVSMVAKLAGQNSPFGGTELAQLESTMAFLSALAFLVGAAVGLYFVGRQLGWGNVGHLAGLLAIGLLVLLTARAAYVANFINYDNQTEFINYASGAPGIRVVMDQVEEISMRTTDGLGVRVAYDDDTSWPMTWYLRDFSGQVFYGGQPSRDSFRDVPLVIAGDANWARVEPLLGDEYYSFEYIRMWWPMQDYFGLDWARIKNAFTDPGYREALWDIWYTRDYTLYGELTGVNYDLSQWPVVDRMRFYVRRDLAAQLWDLGVGPTVLTEPPEPDPFEALWQSFFAQTVWGSEGTAPGQFARPRDLAVGPEGAVFVADTFNHRIQKFDPHGALLASWGEYGNVEEGTSGPGRLNEPWGIAVDDGGFVYVADTWNHRIQKFTGDGEFVAEWGRFGTEGELDAMWGPRDVAVGPEGAVYVTDTGNKRVLVFDPQGTPIRQIGSGGVLEGELDEPVGVAVSKQGLVFVADTWNRRVQVFDRGGLYLREWDVPGWYGQSLDNKPYLELDNQGRVFVADPEGYRVLVFDESGLPLFSFGDFGFDNAGFGLPISLAWDGSDGLYVSDSNNNRIMLFEINIPPPVILEGDPLQPEELPLDEVEEADEAD